MKSAFPFRSLHLSLRFVIPLAIALALLAYGVVPLIDNLNLKWFARDHDIRSRLISSTMIDLLSQEGRGLVQRFTTPATLFAFDLDSILVPIVADPTAAALPEAIR